MAAQQGSADPCSGQVAVCTEKMRHMDEKLDRIIKAIEGPEGLTSRVDRMEQAEKVRDQLQGPVNIYIRLDRLEQSYNFQSKLMWVMGSSLIGLILKAIANHYGIGV